MGEFPPLPVDPLTPEEIALAESPDRLWEDTNLWVKAGKT
jgi:hypothetical protein